MNDYCKMRPKNIGLRCESQDKCEVCGWNPEVEAHRKAETQAKLQKWEDRKNG